MRVSPRRTTIARARLKAGMLQKEFADHCGVSVSYLQKIELGTIAPSKRVRDIAKRLTG